MANDNQTSDGHLKIAEINLQPELDCLGRPVGTFERYQAPISLPPRPSSRLPKAVRRISDNQAAGGNQTSRIPFKLVVMSSLAGIIFGVILFFSGHLGGGMSDNQTSESESPAPGSLAAFLLAQIKNAGCAARHAEEPCTSPYPDGLMQTAWVAGWNETDAAIREQPNA